MTARAKPYAAAVVLAAGMGTRVGANGNKAYLPVADRPMVAWSLDTVTQVDGIERIVLVFRRGERELAADMVRSELAGARIELVEGGDTRHGSERNVLRHLSADIEAGAIDVIAIHDAARPVASPQLFVDAIAVAHETGAAIPALGMTHVVTTELKPLTGNLVRVQTPQAFRAGPLLDAYRAADRDGFEGTDTSSCVEAYGDIRVHTFRGDQRNIKVTYARDIAVAEHLLLGGVSAGGSQ